jgi:hypothetical protein
MKAVHRSGEAAKVDLKASRKRRHEKILQPWLI